MDGDLSTEQAPAEGYRTTVVLSPDEHRKLLELVEVVDGRNAQVFRTAIRYMHALVKADQDGWELFVRKGDVEERIRLLY